MCEPMMVNKMIYSAFPNIRKDLIQDKKEYTEYIFVYFNNHYCEKSSVNSLQFSKVRITER
jgi:hypothetical protein